ncbi:MAG: hypothetical protein V4632_10020 [Pseudomonadota bacterium]
MDKLKTGGKNDLVSVSNVSQHPKLTTLSTLQLAKKSALELKKRMVLTKLTNGKFVVEVKIPKEKIGTSRMLTRSEIDELRQTKHSIAERTMLAFKRG